ncbi:hypothetical protein C5167_005914 [Papaver somniferum]|uniref:Uncharacterized protein n=1 Tax=Papaver somniferum TaxID=3469 RepID=A0A4Y7JFT0_PAPSO|nr:hypothetical protein C5167_005914 [Papaver somniferum]
MMKILPFSDSKNPFFLSLQINRINLQSIPTSQSLRAVVDNPCFRNPNASILMLSSLFYISRKIKGWRDKRRLYQNLCYLPPEKFYSDTVGLAYPGPGLRRKFLARPKVIFLPQSPGIFVVCRKFI